LIQYLTLMPVALSVCMRKVRSGGRRKAAYKQLPLFIENTDPLLSEDPAAGITPEQARAVLKKHGLDITHEEAISVLQFLHHFSDIIVSKFLQHEQNS